MIIYDDKKAASTADLPSEPTAPLRNPIYTRNVSRASTSRNGSLLPPPYPLGNASSSSALTLSTTLSSTSTSTVHGPIFNGSKRNLFPHRSNHLYITRATGPIKGSWIIDTSLKLPPAMLPPVEEGTNRKNLRLHAKIGKVSAKVEVRGNPTPIPTSAHSSESSHSSSSDGRAHLYFRSEMSNIKVKLRRTEVPRLNVSCYTPAGSVTVYLPYDFQGPIRSTTATGSTTLFFSPAAAKRCTSISGPSNSFHSRRCLHFIGHCPGPEETWDQYDELDINARKGHVKILFVDEQEHDFMKQVMKNVQSEGMVNFIGRVVTTSLEKSRDRIAMSRSVSLSNLASYASGGSHNGKIT